MAVKKIKWNQLMNSLTTRNILSTLNEDIRDIDETLNDFVYHSNNYLDGIYTIVLNICSSTEENNSWYDLDIFISSFKENDKRFVNLVATKLREYIAFYKKILNDNGVQRALVYSKEYSNLGDSNSSDRGTDSVTPQYSHLYDPAHPESDELFDQAIANFASSINKSKNSAHSETEGESTTNVTGTTWEEGKKNIQMMFFNELKDYIMSIPERIYSYYSLDTMPVRFLHEEFVNYIKALDSIE